jgi:hypothetical protein
MFGLPREPPSQEEVEQQMLNYLADKYGQEFASYSIGYRGFENGEQEVMLAYPQGGNPRYNFRVTRSGSTFEPTYADGYLGLLMRDDYVALFQPLVDRRFAENRIRVPNLGSTSTFPDLGPDTTFDEFAAYMAANHPVSVAVYVPATAADEATIDATFNLLATDLQAVIRGCTVVLMAYAPQDYELYVVADAANSLADDSPYPYQTALFTRRSEW